MCLLDWLWSTSMHGICYGIWPIIILTLCMFLSACRRYTAISAVTAERFTKSTVGCVCCAQQCTYVPVCFLDCCIQVLAWFSGNGIVHIEEVTLCQAWLALRWMTIHAILVFNQPVWPTQHPTRSGMGWEMEQWQCWEGNCRFGVALAMHDRHWYIYWWTQWPKEGRWAPRLHAQEYGTLYQFVYSILMDILWNIWSEQHHIHYPVSWFE